MYETVRDRHTKKRIQEIINDINVLTENAKTYTDGSDYSEGELDAIEQQIHKLEQIKAMLENRLLSATNKWCDITNALITKYKNLAKNHQEYAIERLTALEELLVKEGFLSEKDIEDIL